MSLSRRRFERRAVLALLGTIGGLALAEASLRALVPVRGWYRARTAVVVLPDRTHRVRLVPGQGKDAWGFNNDRVPERADVVALGDSQTWGSGVARTATWPRVLARLSGAQVYNLAMSSSGPLEYRALFGRGLKLKPRWIVVGLYVGNDLRNAYNAEGYRTIAQAVATRLAGRRLLP